MSVMAAPEKKEMLLLESMELPHQAMNFVKT